METRFEWEMKGGGYWVPVVAEIEDDRIYFSWGFATGWRGLKDTLKAMGAEWHGYDEHNPTKRWSLPLNQRTEFRLAHLLRHKPSPFKLFDKPLEPYKAVRDYLSPDGVICPAYDHQEEMWSQIITRHFAVLACEMGVGKTRAVAEAMEYLLSKGLIEVTDIIYVGPRSAMESVKDDFKEWGFWFRPHMMTYRGLVKEVDTWGEGRPAPKFVVYDESSRVKNPNAQQAQAAKYLADCMRAEHGDDCWIVLMSGSPAPKSPADWYWQCEIARPGFLLEGTHKKFMDRLAIVKRVEDMSGGSYPKLLGWRDAENICTHCAQAEDHLDHDAEAILFGSDNAHAYVKATNEVEKLYKRMRGLVLVKLKKDCLDLPDRVWKVYRVKPTQRILNAAKIITRRAKSVVQGMTLLRELSDGFQYKDQETGEVKCEVCGGSGRQMVKFDPDDPWSPISDAALIAGKKLDEREAACDGCSGIGIKITYERKAKQVPCPKEDIAREILESHNDIGRLVFFAAFTGSVDRVRDVCLGMNWHVIRVDGRGWSGWSPKGEKPIKGDRQHLYNAFRRDKENYPRIAFVGQAGAAGMGLNLSASPTEVFYSNDFNFESRVQALERTYRPGIEKTLALLPEEHRKIMVIDITHLPTDQLVLDNLNKKKRLQALTMGDVQTALACEEERVD